MREKREGGSGIDSLGTSVVPRPRGRSSFSRSLCFIYTTNLLPRIATVSRLANLRWYSLVAVPLPSFHLALTISAATFTLKESFGPLIRSLLLYSFLRGTHDLRRLIGECGDQFPDSKPTSHIYYCHQPSFAIVCPDILNVLLLRFFILIASLCASMASFRSYHSMPQGSPSLVCSASLPILPIPS